MKLVKWLDNNFEVFLIAIMLVGLVAIMSLQVFMRYVMNSSLAWPEELSRYLFIWICFIGISYSTREDLHLKVDIVFEYISKRMKNILLIISDLSILIFSIFMIIGGIDAYMTMAESMQTSSAMKLPFKFVYLALPVGFGITTLRIIQKYILKFLALKNSKIIFKGERKVSNC